MSPPSTSRSRPAVRRRLGLVVLLQAVLVLLGSGLWATAASAAERVVTVTADGVRPQVLTVDPGDTVRFVVEDGTFAYRAQSTAGGWRFDSGPVRLLEGDYVVPAPLSQEGTYGYRVAQDAPFQGTVVVRGGAGASPVASPGTSAVPTAPGPAPSGEPSAGGEPAEGLGPLPPVTTAGASPAPGVLAQRVEARAFGLPAAIAALLVVGTGSLLVRTLLAEPVLSDPPASLRADGAAPPRW